MSQRDQITEAINTLVGDSLLIDPSGFLQMVQAISFNYAVNYIQNAENQVGDPIEVSSHLHLLERMRKTLTDGIEGE